MTTNPFVSNLIPDKDKFIGRKKEIEQGAGNSINQNIFNAGPMNLAIVGIPNIGKSSLVRKAIFKRKDELRKRNILTISIDVAEYSHSKDFFRSLVLQCVTEMKRQNCLTTKVQEAANKVDEEEQMVDHIRTFFTEVAITEHRLLFILDKFDHASEIFDGSTAFNQLRNLISGPDFKISLVLVACRHIKVIEDKAGSSSPFYRLFTPPIRLAMFNDDDLECYFSKYKKVGIDISNDTRNQILYFCGAHPRLLQLFGYHIVNMHGEKGNFDVDEIASILTDDITYYYDQLRTFLEDIDLLQPLLQILSGRDIDQDDKPQLQKYGLIQKFENESYIAYSKHFQEYILNMDLTILPANTSKEKSDIWDQTENALRSIIVGVLSHVYGEDWINTLKNINNRFEEIFDKCQKEKNKKYKKVSGNPENTTPLINYSSTSDLFTIILYDQLWTECFRDTFRMDIIYWKMRKNMIITCRNPRQHSNSESLTDDQKITFEGYCQEILRIYDEWKQKASEGTARESDQLEGRHTGTIIYFGKTFSYILPCKLDPPNENGVFLYQDDYPKKRDDLKKEQKVEFEIEINKKGWQAKEVKIINN